MNVGVFSLMQWPQDRNASRLERVHDGLATTAVEVWSAGGLGAVGVSTSTLLVPK
jgi:hypothetical protein